MNFNQLNSNFDSSILIASGESKMNEGNYQNALQILDLVLMTQQWTPNHVLGGIYKILCLHRVGRTTEAINFAADLLDVIQSQDLLILESTLYTRLGDINEEQGQLNKAFRQYPTKHSECAL